MNAVRSQAQGRNLSKGCMKGYNSVATLLTAQELNVELFDGESIKRPVPLLFAQDRDKALAGLLANPELALIDIGHLNAKFLAMDHLSRKEAAAVIKRTKLRVAKGVPMFSAPVLGEPAAKKAKPDMATSSETGGLKPGLEKTRVFKKKPSPVGFFGFFWVFLGFIVFFGFYWVLLGFLNLVSVT
jgi:hypothetical protein